MGVPPLSPRERRAALDKSVAVRRERAEVKHALKQAGVSLAEVLASDCEAVRTMRVHDLLVSLPGVGKIRALKILTELEISRTRRIQGLGVRQRTRLLARFTSAC